LVGGIRHEQNDDEIVKRARYMIPETAVHIVTLSNDVVAGLLAVAI